MNGGLRSFAARHVQSLHPAHRAGLARTLHPRAGTDHGLLSVIIPVHNVEPYLDRCLAGVVAQSYRNLQVLVVDDGSTDGTASIARGYARRDRRVRVLTLPHGGNGRARNAGIRAASGAFLAFADGDDVVPSDAYRLLMDSLAASGSDFSAGSWCRLRGRARVAVHLADDLHRARRLRATLTEVPEAIHDVFLWNKVFRRSFWDRAVGPMPEGVRYEDQEPTARAFLRARGFDLIPEQVYHWRIRPDGSSITQEKHLAADLGDRLAAATAVSRLLGSEAGAPVLAAWRRRLLDADLLPYLEQAADAGPEYRAVLAAGLADLAPEELLAGTSGVDAQVKVLLDLARRREWDALRTALVGRINHGTATALSIHGTELTAELPYQLPVPVPQALLRADSGALRAVTGITGLHYEPGAVTVTGYAYLTGLAPGGSTVQLRVQRPAREGEDPPAELEVQPRVDPDIDLLSPDRTGSHADAGFFVRVPRPLPDGLLLTLGVGTFTVQTILRLPPATGAGKAAATARDDVLTLDLPDGISGEAFALVTARAALPAVVVARNPDGTVSRLNVRMRLDSWGQELAAPAGTYTLRTRTGRGAAAAEDPAVHIPEEAASGLRPLLMASVRVRPFRTASGALAVAVSAPLAPDEAPLWRQYSRRRHFAERRRGELAPGILFESYGGKSCSDNPRAISDYLAAAGFDEPLYWSVSDRSVPLPDYAVPLIQGSREWFERLATVRRLVNNNNFPWFFRKNHGQVYLQTWHGTPLKRLGRDAPAAGISLSYRDLMSREAASWDLLLAQSSYAAGILPRALGYDGPVLTAGYPRNDALVRDDGAGRARVRARLGIPPEQQVLLYAPTWRQEVRDAAGRSGAVGHLDVRQAVRLLGPGFTVLVRGHHNTAGTRQAAGPAALDVTDYPEATDLYLASDALITDYSSALFDYALLGRPMYFLAPDLDRYAGVRGFYLDPAATLPGPLVRTTAELAAAVAARRAPDRRLGEFRAAYAPDVGRASAAAALALLEAGERNGPRRARVGDVHG